MRLRAQRTSPHGRRKPLLIEQLEDRNLLSGNLLITAEVPNSPNYNLMQYTQQGALVSSQPVPPAPGSTETPDARGLSVGPSGNIDIFDGTQTPSLATLSSTTQNWLFQTAPGWGAGSNITYGNVVAYNNYVFASDMQSSNGQSYGLVRFDSSGGSPTFYAPGSSFIQIALGQDGYLYGLEGSSGGPQAVEVFNPDTLDLVRTFTLNSTTIRSIAVDGSGNIFAASYAGTVAEYDSTGNATGTSVQLVTGPFNFPENLVDIALDTDGQIAVGGVGGEIYLTNESLTNVHTIKTGQANVFVTFDHYIAPAPQQITPSFSNLAGPTITYGQSSVTLGGQISSSSGLPPGDVNITVNGVTQSAAINQTDGSFSASFDTSTLGVSGSPYTITYSYPGQNNYASITDASQSLTVAQAVTTLTNLSAPTIIYGTPTATFSGTLGSNSVLPVGQDVTVTLLGANGPVASGSGTIGSNGQFSANINTASLGAGSYTIQYAYAGDANFTAATDPPNTLTVSQATTTLSGLSSPTVVIGTQTATFSGTVGSDSVLPAGQSVTVTLLGANGALASSSGVIGSDGSFSASISTDALRAGSYTIQYSYAGDPNFQASSGSGTLQVTYAVKVLSDTSWPVHAGGVLPIRLQVADASGDNLSSAHLTVTAISLVGPNGQTYTPHARGHANLANEFRHVHQGYVYNLDTRGLPAGTYTLLVKVGDDPVLHAVTFTVSEPWWHRGHHRHHEGHREHHEHHDSCKHDSK
jgi:hypothetical protein